jgi:peptide/nickel transport system permease protein
LASYIVRRLLLGIIVLFLVTIIIFLLIQIVPGDPAITMLGPQASKEQLEDMRKQLWLDRPLPVQYEHWLIGAVHFRFGESIYHENIGKGIVTRLPITLYYSLIALVFGTMLGIAAGIVCAVKRGSTLDSVITFLANFGISVPVFWLGALGIYYFGLKLNWLPVQGYISPFDNFVQSLEHAIMPIICLAIPCVAVLARQTRSSMLEVLHRDYIRTARSKGLLEKVVIIKHALKNALIPVVTLLGLQLGFLFGGSVLVERVFNIPGMGRFLVQGATNKDVPVVQGCTLVIALAVVLVNLMVDISYGWFDPRIHYE